MMLSEKNAIQVKKKHLKNEKTFYLRLLQLPQPLDRQSVILAFFFQIFKAIYKLRIAFRTFDRLCRNKISNVMMKQKVAVLYV